jgi:hypothetical protein
MPVTIRECPHCFTRVGFLEDEVCPACRKRLSEAGADPTRTLFTVSQVSTHVQACMCCGRDTTDRVAISEGTRSRTMSLLAGFGEVLGYCLAPILRGGFIGIIYSQDRKKYPHWRVRVSIPLCRSCRRSHGVPKPHRVDFEKATMSFLISREVALRLSNGAEPGTAPNGGPAAAVGSSEVTKGPPSVS